MVAVFRCLTSRVWILELHSRSSVPFPFVGTCVRRIGIFINPVSRNRVGLSGAHGPLLEPNVLGTLPTQVLVTPNPASLVWSKLLKSTVIQDLG